jgi:hypothetical protein
MARFLQQDMFESATLDASVREMMARIGREKAIQ